MTQKLKMMQNLERKWDIINENRITRNELSLLNKNKIKLLLKKNMSTKDISQKIGMNYKSTWQIIKKIKE